jgi:hypothetical protein
MPDKRVTLTVAVIAVAVVVTVVAAVLSFDRPEVRDPSVSLSVTASADRAALPASGVVA